jgi:hypothetical protein
MTALLLCCCLTPQVPAWAPAPSATGTIVLLAGTAEYQAAKGVEQSFEGKLQRASGSTDRRTALYQLIIPEDVGRPRIVRPIHALGKVHLLEPHAGKRVRIIGKLVRDGESERLWAGKLEVLLAPRAAEGILARGFWQPAAVLRRGTSTVVYRSGAELARAMNVKGQTAEQTATRLLAKRLGVETIDWHKHMVVTICAGLVLDGGSRLTITSARQQQRTLTISYRLESGNLATALSYPVETVLVKRHSGPVRFEKAPGPERRK